jgi:hypothetical protein
MKRDLTKNDVSHSSQNIMEQIVRKCFIFVQLFVLLVIISCSSNNQSTNPIYKEGEIITIEKSVLMDKIMGGWAGQVIGCTYGGPTEFKFNGTMIGDHVPIPWDEHQMLWWYENVPGLYDDIYMDLTFVEVFEEYGLDAHDTLHAQAFAHADYRLWHANQAARYNILNGIMPPASGHWKNNPHADDIDFQIEADFIGLMSPGMVKSATDIGWRIGHIMNYGDGVYGGIYVAAMYSLAFIHNDIEFVVSEALKTIPAESDFYKCIADVIKSYKQNPNDWKYAWFEAQKNWTFDKGCPTCVFRSSNIDAKINAAYIVIGLLYGKGDFGATVDISTRCGYDSDCNPANAAGILATMTGYSNIPEYWKQGIDKVEDLDFSYTNMSLNRVYEVGFKHAVEVIKRNGGSENDSIVSIRYQPIQTVPFEASFEGIYPTSTKKMYESLTEDNTEISFEFTGCGFVVSGVARKEADLSDDVLEIDVFINDRLTETVKMPTEFRTRRHDVAWKYDLPEGTNSVTLKAKSIPKGYRIDAENLLLYSTIDPGTKIYY